MYDSNLSGLEFKYQLKLERIYRWTSPFTGFFFLFSLQIFECICHCIICLWFLTSITSPDLFSKMVSVYVYMCICIQTFHTPFSKIRKIRKLFLQVHAQLLYKSGMNINLDNFFSYTGVLLSFQGVLYLKKSIDKLSSTKLARWSVKR